MKEKNEEKNSIFIFFFLFFSLQNRVTFKKKDKKKIFKNFIS